MARPHDGIVERDSNNLIPSDAGRQTEKHDSIVLRGLPGKTYAHVQLKSCDDLTHVDLQKDRDVFLTVSEIILARERGGAPVQPGLLPLADWSERLAQRAANGDPVRRRKTVARFGP